MIEVLRSSGEKEKMGCVKAKKSSEKLRDETPVHLKREKPSVQADWLPVLISLPVAMILVTALYLTLYNILIAPLTWKAMGDCKLIC